MSADTSKLQAAAICELCKPLRLPTVATQATRLAEQAAKEKQSPLSFLEALLSAEVEEREQNAVARRIDSRCCCCRIRFRQPSLQ
jgi:hypothetical protein